MSVPGFVLRGYRNLSKPIRRIIALEKGNPHKIDEERLKKFVQESAKIGKRRTGFSPPKCGVLVKNRTIAGVLPGALPGRGNSIT